MNIVVLKFGGTSVRDRSGFEKSMVHIKKELQLNNKVICVVSAMGRDKAPYATDTLKNLIKNYVTKKEQDRLLSIGEIISSIVFADFLIEHGICAISLSTKEIGIITNNQFTNADIIDIKNDFIIEKLKDYDVIVIPGFQGLTIDNEVTTLGRGGSDTTAIAIGVSLNAKRVDIISDVKGVFTADPQYVPTAKKIPRLNYEILCDMTHNGSKVLHNKGAIFARKNKLPLRFVDIEDYNSFTVVEDCDVYEINLSYKNDYIKYKLNKDINDKNLYKFNDEYYIHLNHEKDFKTKLEKENIEYEREIGFSKITIIDYTKGRKLFYHFVETTDVFKKLNELHQKIIQ